MSPAGLLRFVGGQSGRERDRNKKGIQKVSSDLASGQSE